MGVRDGEICAHLCDCESRPRRRAFESRASGTQPFAALEERASVVSCYGAEAETHTQDEGQCVLSSIVSHAHAGVHSEKSCFGHAADRCARGAGIGRLVPSGRDGKRHTCAAAVCSHIDRESRPRGRALGKSCFVHANGRCARGLDLGGGVVIWVCGLCPLVVSGLGRFQRAFQASLIPNPPGRVDDRDDFGDWR